ncbi:UNVERIFIED_CONTAM: hypothetical protein Slati_4595700 [Sesamum latifolium]|uniref:Uncharacterized protein n=1 Tax=Sesamum latifolium TaxID=2727402 RepID=A0AAW2S1X1_9LAMI
MEGLLTDSETESSDLDWYTGVNSSLSMALSKTFSRPSKAFHSARHIARFFFDEKALVDFYVFPRKNSHFKEVGLSFLDQGVHSERGASTTLRPSLRTSPDGCENGFPQWDLQEEVYMDQLFGFSQGQRAFSVQIKEVDIRTSLPISGT